TWTPQGFLQTSIRASSEMLHPETGEPVWFNHIWFWHSSHLDPDLRRRLRLEYGGLLPYEAVYGDGTPVEDAVARHIGEAYAAETRTFPWRAGDLLIVDNMLAAHGRAPFRGP